MDIYSIWHTVNGVPEKNVLVPLKIDVQFYYNIPTSAMLPIYCRDSNRQIEWNHISNIFKALLFLKNQTHQPQH